MSKMADLQSALKHSSGRVTAEQSVSVPTSDARKERPAKATANAGSREGKENIAAWLPSSFKRSIRLVQAQRPGDPSLQDLMAEAFNDLFIKYNVPTVSE